MTSSLTGCLTHSNPPIITYLHTKVCSGLNHISHLWSSNGHGIILQNLHSCYKHCSVLQRLCVIPSKDHKFSITIEDCQTLDYIWRHKPQCILEREWANTMYIKFSCFLELADWDMPEVWWTRHWFSCMSRDASWHNMSNLIRPQPLNQHKYEDAVILFLFFFFFFDISKSLDGYELSTRGCPAITYSVGDSISLQDNYILIFFFCFSHCIQCEPSASTWC